MFQAFWWCSCGFSSLWCPLDRNWSYFGFLGIIWRTWGSKLRGGSGGIFPTLCVEFCLVITETVFLCSFNIISIRIHQALHAHYVEIYIIEIDAELSLPWALAYNKYDEYYQHPSNVKHLCMYIYSYLYISKYDVSERMLGKIRVGCM